MPRKSYDRESFKIDGWTFDDQLFYVDRTGCMRLIPHDLTTKEYQSGGFFEDTEVELPEYKATGLTGMYAIMLSSCIPEGTDIRFQISTDGGTTYQIYDGNDWVEDINNDFASVEDMNCGLPELPIFPKRSFRIKFKLFTSADQKVTPIIFDLSVTFDLCYNPREDLKRSLKRFVEERLNAKFKWSRKLSFNTFSFQLITKINVSEVTGVFNATTDPERVNNIFDSFDQNTSTITVTEEILANQFVLVEYKGCPKIYIGVDHDFVDSELPAIVIDIPSTVENRIYKSAARHNEAGPGSKKARLRQCAFVKDNKTKVYSLSAYDLDSYAISDALDRLFIDVVKVPSLDTGYIIPIVDYMPMTDIDRDKEGLHLKATDFTSVTIEPNEIFEELFTVEEVNVNVNIRGC